MTNPEAARMHHFANLPRAEQLAAIRRLQAAGYTLDGVSHATGWAREALAEALAAPESASINLE